MLGSLHIIEELYDWSARSTNRLHLLESPRILLPGSIRAINTYLIMELVQLRSIPISKISDMTRRLLHMTSASVECFISFRLPANAQCASTRQAPQIESSLTTMLSRMHFLHSPQEQSSLVCHI